MKTQSSSVGRNRAEIVADMNSVSRAVSGKITEKRRTLKNGKVVVYHQLQQWIDGRNVTTHIPQSRIEAFKAAVGGHEKLQSLMAELSTVDTKAVLENSGVKKNGRNNREVHG